MKQFEELTTEDMFQYCKDNIDGFVKLNKNSKDDDLRDAVVEYIDGIVTVFVDYSSIENTAIIEDVLKKSWDYIREVFSDEQEVS